jgi:hypothetical protein
LRSCYDTSALGGAACSLQQYESLYILRTLILYHVVLVEPDAALD